MTTTLNIRNAEDRAKIERDGYKWVTVISRGDNKGQVCSRHHIYETASEAAKDTDRTIVDVRDGGSF